MPSSLTQCNSILNAARKADGSLPDLNGYFQLAEGSDLIDAGTDVGLAYEGTAPDLGAFEYGEEEPTTGIKLLKYGSKLLKKGTKFLK